MKYIYEFSLWCLWPRTWKAPQVLELFRKINEFHLCFEMTEVDFGELRKELLAMNIDMREIRRTPVVESESVF